MVEIKDRFFLIICVFICNVILLDRSHAQVDSFKVPRIFLAEIGFGALHPTGAFRQNIKDPRFSMETGIMIQVKPEKPLFAGFQLNYSPINTFSGEVNRETNFGFEQWDATTRSNFLSTQLFGRYFVNINPFGLQPYFDFGFGLNWLFTATEYTFINSEENSRDLEELGIVPNYGFGFGLNYYVGSDLYVKSSIHYSTGLSAPYFIRTRDHLEDFPLTTLEAFDRKQSTTDVLRWDVGITYAF